MLALSLVSLTALNPDRREMPGRGRGTFLIGLYGMWPMLEAT